MLWESVDPITALRERFKFDDFATASAWVSTTLRNYWGVQVTDTQRLVISDRNAIAWVRTAENGDCVVKWSMSTEHFDRLSASTRIIGILGESGVPVATPLSSPDGAVRIIVAGPAGPMSMAVLPHIDGDWLATDNAEAVKRAGATLAGIHETLGRLGEESEQFPTSDQRSLTAPTTASSGPTSASTPFEFRDSIGSWLNARDRGLAPAASRVLHDLLQSAPDFTDVPQLVHRDFRSANILTSGSRIVGVLDFDDMVRGHRVMDLAQASVYLNTRFTNWAPTKRSAQLTLRTGYETVRPLGHAESDWFDILLLWLSINAIPGPDDAFGWTAAANSLAETLSRTG